MGDEGDVEKCGKRKGLIVVVVASELVELGDISKGFVTWIFMSITNMSVLVTITTSSSKLGAKGRG